MENDLLLVRDAKGGNSEGFRKLVKRYFSWVLLFFQKRFTIEFQCALDLTQETFLKVFEKLSTYDESKALFKTWLVAISRNVAIDYFRKNGSNHRSSPPPPLPPPYNLEDRAVTRMVVRQALDGLPERQRDIVIMKYFWELTCNEIAEALDIPTGTVKGDLSYARRKLSNLLGMERKS